MELEFIITDNFPCRNGWTPRELATAAAVKMLRIGIRLFASNIGSDGLQQGSLSKKRDYIAKKFQANRIIASILDTEPPELSATSPSRELQ
jgi:hypothetical protein